ncbi:uncharacterized protein GLRG_09345 [Colletotrichum graminicola M1.001]|uniref:Uncharacterized protein n=1 Tax=Colletotrichum graminicola (strain M1.001 / M2 / FGSC 10212) TaxID=645133 RepID=E3QTN9_COLGM|nr:uncharacterized protein GLRG_09345 [Colletotrichum graminicola M1.001]EFQ34201.1 hypothetical protein GLRG_09345 [Colletotrichum graminicola M1.001]
MEFRFVNHGPGRPNNRKVIRSHVMKGKNSGKRHVSRGQTRRKQETPDGPAPPPPGDIVTTFRRMISVPLAKPCTLPSSAIRKTPSSLRGSTNSLQTKPVSASSRKTKDLKSLIPLNSMAHYSKVFHVSLSVTAAWLDFFEYKERESPAAIAHMTQAFALVNQRLSGPESTSDQTIALVCMLVCQESIRGDLERYRTHLLGLTRMVELRGGIHVLEEKDDVVHKIFR